MAWELVGRERELGHARELVETGTGVAVLGPAGVGKSRLLREIVDLVTSATLPTLQLAATKSTRSIPFAPFAAVVPTAPAWDRLEVFREALAGLRSRVGPCGLLLAVDDAHHLDAGSLALLTSVLREDGITVCLTARSAEPLDADLAALWTDGLMQRIDLGALERASVLTLLDATLGSFDLYLGDELWRLSAGNPLVLHELVEGAAGHTIDRGADGVWRQTADLTDTPCLADLIAARLSRVPEELHEALTLVAVGDPVPLTLLEEAVGAQVEELRRRNLVRIATIEDGPSVTPAHPLYGELLRRRLSVARTRDASRALHDAAMRLPVPFDALRTAIWQHDAGVITHPAAAVAAARAALARHDGGLAEQLVRPVADSSPGYGGTIVLRDSEVARVWIVDQGGSPPSPMVFFAPVLTDDTEWLSEADAVVESMVFGPVQEPLAP